MDFDSFPILNVYLESIRSLEDSGQKLPFIFLIGGTTELLLREIAEDEDTPMGTVGHETGY